MKQYLFLFSIGPVQSFIAQARKTQDLYAGSQILSELAKAGLKAANPKEHIFPNSTSNPSVPNRFLCIVEHDNISDFGKKIVEKAVRDEWDKMAKPVLAISKDGIKEQIDNHLDINWAFVEIENTEGGYAKAYEKIERLLGAIKNVRSFEQFNYQLDKEGNKVLGEKGRKCSLDGERNVKFYRLNENESKEDTLAKKLFMYSSEVKIIAYNIENEFKYNSLQAGEGLSAVSMVKRLYNGKRSFESTADIALKYTIEEVEKYEEGQSILDTFKIIGDKMNAQLYYEENHTEAYYKKQGINVGGLKQLKDTQKQLGKFIRTKNLQLLKYYAIIDFDGDNMGKWLSGINISNPNENLKEFHQMLSEKLAEFAKEAKKIVNNYGQTVYAGGDDFLGFVNLNYLFKAMQELRNTFKGLVNDKLQELGYLKTELSFSAGVCIAHYKEPLGMVLAKAAAAQKTAKAEEKGGDRNAFSIVASKHSGENHEAYFKWATDCKNVTNLGCLVRQLMSKNGFSNTFIKSINIEFSKMTDSDGKLQMDRELLAAETLRLLRRSFMGKKDDKKEKSEEMAAVIMSIYDEAKSFENFINALNICDFLHRLLGTGSDLGELPQIEKELCNVR